MSDAAPRLHEVVLLTRSIETPAGSADIIENVIVDGMELMVPEDSQIVVTAHMPGVQVISVDIVAAHIEYQTLEEQP